MGTRREVATTLAAMFARYRQGCPSAIQVAQLHSGRLVLVCLLLLLKGLPSTLVLALRGLRLRQLYQVNYYVTVW